MRTAKPIRIEGKGFYCDPHKKTHDGVGYVYNAKGYCLAEYKKQFPNFKENK